MSQQDGEKELVLGNKQLISLFFVVVALCGVFFAMGYMIGHNSSKAVVANLESNSQSAGATAAPESREAQPTGTDTAADPAPQPAGDAEAPHDSVPVETHPAQDTPAASPTASVVPASVARPEPRTQKLATLVPKAGSTYLQVTALRRTDADNLVKTLKEQNFPAMLAESSRPELARVLVGPYHQTVDVADAKARLKALGFANAFVYK
jgi:cell division septation protein DedD